MFRLFLTLFISVWLAACANSSTIVTGPVTDAIDFTKVKVFYGNSPDCEFEVIAHITIPGEYYNRASLIDGFRQKAAAVGAPAVHITHLQQAGSSVFYGSARAIRCNQK